MNSIYTIKEINANANIEFIDPVNEALIIKAEKFLGKNFPEIIRKIILDFGVLSINPDTLEAPFLMILGLGEGSDMFSDIVLFNLPDNPSIPENFFVFGHEYNGEKDIFYALDENGLIHSNINGYAPHYLKNAEVYARLDNWNEAYNTFKDFWNKKVKKYLQM